MIEPAHRAKRIKVVNKWKVFRPVVVIRLASSKCWPLAIIKCKQIVTMLRISKVVVSVLFLLILVKTLPLAAGADIRPKLGSAEHSKLLSVMAGSKQSHYPSQGQQNLFADCLPEVNW